MPGMPSERPNPGRVVTDRGDQRLNVPPTHSVFKAWVTLPREMGQGLIPGQRAVVRFTLSSKTLFQQAMKVLLQTVNTRAVR